VPEHDVAVVAPVTVVSARAAAAPGASAAFAVRRRRTERLCVMSVWKANSSETGVGCGIEYRG